MTTNPNNKVYLKKLSIIQINRVKEQKKLDYNYNKKVGDLQEQFNIQPSPRATSNDLKELISIIIETGCNGTKAIKQYALETGKDDLWRKSIARQRAGKSFKNSLSCYEANPVIVKVKYNGFYDVKDIINNSITGALRKLSKQITQSNNKDKLTSEKDTLVNLLTIKTGV